MESWSKQFEEVPRVESPDGLIISKLAKADRLKRYSDIENIDSIVARSHGAYTHDDVFNLDSGFAHSLLLMYYEQNAYLERSEQVKNEMKK